MTVNDDLMSEAVSLVPRLECRCTPWAEPVLLGLNNLDWLFVYFGSDPMYRFDEQGRLRRAFVDGQLLRTTGQTLAVMDRQSTSRQPDPHRTESVLLRHDLTPDLLLQFQRRVRSELESLSSALSDAEILRQYPVEVPDIRQTFEAALRRAIAAPVFLAPAIVRR